METERCHVCKTPTTVACSRCRSVFYCKQLCQSLDWKKHKLYCPGYTCDTPIRLQSKLTPITATSFENDKVAVVFFHTNCTKVNKTKLNMDQGVVSGCYKLKGNLHRWEKKNEQLVEFQCVRADIFDITTKKVLAKFCSTPGHAFYPGVYKPHGLFNNGDDTRYQTKLLQPGYYRKEQSTFGIVFNEHTKLKRGTVYGLSLKLCPYETCICQGEGFNVFYSTRVKEEELMKFEIVWAKK